MAKSKSTNSLPPRDVIAWRVESQRKRVWQARAICDITAQAARAAETGGSASANFSESAWSAMEAVSDLLDSIASKLESEVVLAQPKPGEGGDEEAQP
jgi:hypothetical protein